MLLQCLNPRQRIVVIVGVGVFASMWLYCPWRRTGSVYVPRFGENNQSDMPVGYAFILSPGESAYEGWGSYEGKDPLSIVVSFVKGGPFTYRNFGNSDVIYWIDWTRLGIQWIILVPLVVVGVLWFDRSPQTIAQDSAASHNLGGDAKGIVL